MLGVRRVGGPFGLSIDTLPPSIGYSSIHQLFGGYLKSRSQLSYGARVCAP